MAEVLLFHHAQGLTDGVRAFADSMRNAGSDVITPDLYDGRVFGDLEEGVSHAESIGFERLLDMGEAEAADLGSDVVFAGFSLGALVAHRLAQNRVGARGALLYHHGDVPITTFGDDWPKGVDLQIHVAEEDPFLDMEVVEQFVERAGARGSAELFLYPGSAHLFTDSSLPGYDARSTRSVLGRSLELLDRLG